MNRVQSLGAHCRDVVKSPTLFCVCTQALQVVLPATVSITIHNDITPPGVAFPEQWFAGVEEFIVSDASNVEYDDDWFTMNTVSFQEHGRPPC
jgi:hypothetical protein